MTATDLDERDTPQAADGTAPVPTQVDGRHARSERSRQAMVDALLDLLKEGNLRPSATQIAERAGVTQRTLFNQFGDMESLVLAAATRQAQRVVALVPDAGTGSLEARVLAYAEGLAHLFEETMHVRWAVITSPTPSESAAGAIELARVFMRDHLAVAFAPELDAVPDQREQILNALDLQLDPSSWRLRRLQGGLSIEDARAALARTVLAVLRDATA